MVFSSTECTDWESEMILFLCVCVFFKEGFNVLEHVGFLKNPSLTIRNHALEKKHDLQHGRNS